MTLLVFAIFLGFLIWGIKSGQFKNVEEAKYQLFRTHKTDNPEKKGKQLPQKEAQRNDGYDG